ncbi:MAG TPA: dienelactone hydrolase family protein [Candidatus Polarisedimenticolia bacterium]|nr:dienelactone hydrolase family protein [Candidatus Polarisedimenticolia bacterium]
MTRAEWVRREAPRLRKAIRKVLGPTFPAAPLSPRVTRREERLGFTIEQVSFNSAKRLRIPALFLRPHVAGPSPALLYCHNHAHDYAWGKGEILEGKGRMPAIGPILARAGFCVLGIDAWCFGERRADENAVAKSFLLQGRTLWGMMLEDERSALDYLESRSEVDARRIGCFGFSMGSTKAWWLAALDPRIRAAAGACGLTTYRALIEAEALNRHGIYFYVPGILGVAEVGQIVSLIAPRPFLSLSGDEDAGSPLPGVAEAHREAGRVYRLLGARGSLVRRVYPAGHEFTAAMLKDTLAWFGRHLKPRAFIAP